MLHPVYDLIIHHVGNWKYFFPSLNALLSFDLPAAYGIFLCIFIHNADMHIV